MTRRARDNMMVEKLTCICSVNTTPWNFGNLFAPWITVLANTYFLIASIYFDWIIIVNRSEWIYGCKAHLSSQLRFRSSWDLCSLLFLKLSSRCPVCCRIDHILDIPSLPTEPTSICKRNRCVSALRPHRLYVCLAISFSWIQQCSIHTLPVDFVVTSE